MLNIQLRIREPGEVEPPSQKETKLKRSFYIQVTCRYCKGLGHNTRGCPSRKANAQSQSQPEGQASTSQNKVMYIDDSLHLK